MDELEELKKKMSEIEKFLERIRPGSSTDPSLKDSDCDPGQAYSLGRQDGRWVVANHVLCRWFGHKEI